jgi:hypothetical protein
MMLRVGLVCVFTSLVLACSASSGGPEPGPGGTGLPGSGQGGPSDDPNGSGSNGSGQPGSGSGGSSPQPGPVPVPSTISSSIIDVEGGTTPVATGGGLPPGNGMPEVCDGTDTNGNGVIDDVDVDNDGICDCLRIATLGLKGRWGQGDVFATWLNSRSDAGAVDLAAQVLTPQLLASFQVIVAQDLSENGREYSDAEVQALEAWVKGGGGFMTLIGYAGPEERTNVNKLLSPFGMSYGPEQILQKQGNLTIGVTGWQPHPVTNGVTAIGTDNGYPVVGAGTAIGTANGFDVLRALEVTDGRVLMWADEWITYNSEWESRPDYQVELFWVNAIKWLTSPKECQVPVPPRLLEVR